MKKLLFVIILLLANLASKAQEHSYVPFPQNDAEWDVNHQGYECEVCYRRFYHMSGDTLINNKTYKKIIHKGYSGSPNYQTRQCDNWVYYDNSIYHGALRDDTIARKVYFIEAGHTYESLLYDFNLEVGDALPYTINNTFLGDAAIIESIYMRNIGGIPRRTYVIAETYYTEIIEGIGSTTGLTEDVFNFECGGWLMCHSVDNQKIYPNSDGVCQLLVAFEQYPSPKPNQFSPNPSDGIFVLSTEIKPKEIKIYNTFGQLIYANGSLDFETIINLSNFPSGIYLCRLMSGTGAVIVEKLILRK